MPNKTYNKVQLRVKFTQASDRANIGNSDTNGENIAVSFGKLSKWYEALVPTGGSSGKILAWNSSGTAKWSDPLHPAITKSADTTSTVSPAHGGTFTTVDSVTRDANGHVTKINTKTVTLPSDQNTDTKVRQSQTTATNYRPILFGAKNSTDVSTLADTITDEAYTSTKMYAQPSTGLIYCTGRQIENVTIQTGSTKQAHITLQTLMTWLITTKTYIPSGKYCHVIISTTWAYANNDILQVSIDGINYEIQLAGVIIEFIGNATSYNAGMFRLLIHSSPTTSFTPASGYTAFPVSTIAEYTCNGSDYSPTWKKIWNSHPTYTSKSSGLYKITVDGTGHVSAATAVAKADITALGIPGSDTNTTYTLGTSGNNVTLTPSSGSVQSITVPYATSATTASKLGSSTVGSTRRPIYLNSGTATEANYMVSHFGNAGKSNMNDVGKMFASVGMANLSDPSNAVDNPMNGTTKSTSWHLYWDASYSDDPSGSNAWVAQIANKAGTAQWWVRSRQGGTITNGTEWAAGWEHLTITSQAGAGSATNPVYVDSNGHTQACTYSLNKSVPSNAVFTDTDTKVNVTLNTSTKSYLLATTTAPTSTAAGVTSVADTNIWIQSNAVHAVKYYGWYGQKTNDTRQSTANLTCAGKGAMQLIIVSSTLTTGRPAADGYIMDFDWDNTGHYKAQLFIPNSTAYNSSLQWRGQTGSSDWSATACAWRNVLDANNLEYMATHSTEFKRAFDLDIPMSPILRSTSFYNRANRFALIGAGKIVVQYSSNNGSTWTDMAWDTTDNTTYNKAILFNDTINASVPVGPRDSSDRTTSMKTRIIVTVDDRDVMVDQFLFQLNSAYQKITVTLEASKVGSVDTFETLSSLTTEAWDYQCCINTKGIRFTTSSGNYAKLRITFGYSTINSSYKTSVSTILGIAAYSGIYWGTNPLVNGNTSKTDIALYDRPYAWMNDGTMLIPTQLKIFGGNYGTFIRSDGTNTYFLLTNSGYAQTGSWNNLRPLYFSNSTGFVTMENGASISPSLSVTGTANITGNTAIGGNITITSSGSLIQKQNSTSNWTSAIRWWSGGTDPGNYGPCIAQHNTGGDSTYPGSITILPYNTTTQPWNGGVGLFIKKDHVYIDGVELSKSGHTHSYIPMSGSMSVTGNIEITKASGDTGFYAKRSDTGVEVWMGVGSGGTNHGIYSNKLGKWMMYGDATNVYLNGTATTATKATQDGDGNTISSTYLKLSGGTMTGIIKKNAPTSGAYIKARDNALVYANADAKTSSLFCVFGGAKSKTGFWGVGTTPTDDSLFFSWGSDTNYANNTNTTNNFSISSTGAFSGTAAAWTTARTLTLSGAVTGSASIKGDTNISLVTTVNHTHNYAGSSSAGGAANSSDVLNSNTRMDYGWNGVNYFNISGTAGNAVKVNDTPTTAWWHIMRFNHANSSGYYTDLAIPFNAVSLYYKRITSGSVQNGGWVKVLDALNVGYVMSSSVIKYDPHARRFTSSKTDSTWNAQAYSNTGYADNVYVSFRPGQTTMYAMIGLDANPSEDANYNKIDYCWYIKNDGTLLVYESGTSVSITGHTTYASGDEFRVEYSCGEIRYYHNGTMCRSVARAVSGKLFFDSSFYNAGNVYDFSYGTSTHSTHTAQIITSTYKSSTYVTSLTSSAITLSDAASSFGGWICGPTKNGRIVISSYQGDNDKLYFGYGERGRTTNSYVKAMTWDGPTNTLTADKFVGALQGNVTGNCSGSSGSCTGTAANANKINTEVGSSAGERPVFYAYLGDNTRVVYNTSFTYNPGLSGGVLYAPYTASKLRTLLTARQSSLNLATTGVPSMQLLLATSSCSTGKPAQDGYVMCFDWDNSGNYQSQFFIPAEYNAPPQYRCQGGSSTWQNSGWIDIGTHRVMYTNDNNTSATVDNVAVPTHTQTVKIVFKSSSGVYSMVEVPYLGSGKFATGLVQVGSLSDGSGSARIIMKSFVLTYGTGSSSGVKFSFSFSTSEQINGTTVTQTSQNLYAVKLIACT